MFVHLSCLLLPGKHGKTSWWHCLFCASAGSFGFSAVDCSFHLYENGRNQESRARIALVSFTPPPFPFTQKTDPETTQCLFIPVLLVHAAGRMWVQQGLLCLIETQLSSVGSSLVRRLALEFSSRWKWGSCGSCSLGDERFSRLAQAAHPCGGARTRGAARVRACSPPVCAAPGALRGAARESGCSSDLLQS